jgi:hypothetical protein
MSCDPNTLMYNARCIDKQILGPGMQLAVAIYLLCQIAENGGGGGGGGAVCVTPQSGPPLGVVTPTCEGQLYNDSTTPGFWISTGLTSADWQQLV